MQPANVNQRCNFQAPKARQQTYLDIVSLEYKAAARQEICIIDKFSMIETLPLGRCVRIASSELCSSAYRSFDVVASKVF